MLLRYGAGLLAFVALMLGAALWLERNRSASLERQLVAAKAELQRISATRNEQRPETQRNIDLGNERIVYRDRIVRQIENRPLPPGCKTPDVQEWGAGL